MVVLAHVSDLHLDGTPDSEQRAVRVFDYLDGLGASVDAVIVTGDIADHGRPEEYETAAQLLASSARPVLTCPGNHDARAAFRRFLLGEQAGDAPINRVHMVGPLVVAMCDSTVPGRDHGFLDDATLVWLSGVLADAAGSPAVICFHHPPAVLHIPFVDEIRLHADLRLAELVERHANVVAVLCGHAHTAAAATFAGRPLLIAPGVASTLRLPWEAAEPLDRGLPPGVAFHVFDDGRLTTHYRVVPAIAETAA